jgi:acetyltransferase-like isoleucine patch superfamily enzyme
LSISQQLQDTRPRKRRTPSDVKKVPPYTRGWFIRHLHCEGRGPLRAGRGTRIKVGNGELRLNGKLWIADHVGIYVGGFGEDPAVLSVGADTIIQARTHINCLHGITLGNTTRISWDVEIMDCDFHGIVIDGEQGPITAPVVIEDRVWVAAHATILKGVTIGHDSVVGTGAVVTRSAPPFSLLAGSPARVVKRIDGWIP